MSRRALRLHVGEESTTTLRAARIAFGSEPELFADLLAEIDAELRRRDLSAMATHLKAFLVAPPAEVA